MNTSSKDVYACKETRKKTKITKEEEKRKSCYQFVCLFLWVTTNQTNKLLLLLSISFLSLYLVGEMTSKNISIIVVKNFYYFIIILVQKWSNIMVYRLDKQCYFSTFIFKISLLSTNKNILNLMIQLFAKTFYKGK